MNYLKLLKLILRDLVILITSKMIMIRIGSNNYKIRMKEENKKLIRNKKMNKNIKVN